MNSGEDPFDAFVGLIGMIEVVDGRRDEGSTSAGDVITWEGLTAGLIDLIIPCKSGRYARPFTESEDERLAISQSRWSRFEVIRVHGKGQYDEALGNDLGGFSNR